MQSGIEKVLATLTEADGSMSGAEIGKATKMWSGALYPVLLNLEKEGKVESFWEEEKFPRRRMYRLRTA